MAAGRSKVPWSQMRPAERAVVVLVWGLVAALFVSMVITALVVGG